MSGPLSSFWFTALLFAASMAGALAGKFGALLLLAWLAGA